MKFFNTSVGEKQGVLRGYVHDVSDELSNVSVRPAVLVLPGGGYMTCSEREAEPVALSFMAEGYHSFVLKYTTGKEVTFEDSFADAEAALEYLRVNAKELGIDATKIAVVGFSAGGHLAAALGTLGKVKPAALVLGYPAILAKLGEGINKVLPGVDEHVTVDTPPTFIFNTHKDSVVPVESTFAFASALDRAGVKYELHMFLKGDHGLSLAKAHTSNGLSDMVNEDVAQWFPLSMKFLKHIWGEFLVCKDNVPYGEVGNTYEIGVDKAIHMLLRVESAKTIIEKYFPQIVATVEKQPSVGLMSLRKLVGYSKDSCNEEQFKELEEALAALN